MRRARTNLNSMTKTNYPEDTDLISVIIGSLLADANGELRGNVRFCFKQSAKHSGYLLWLHDFFAICGLCNSLLPEIKTLLGPNGITYFTLKFYTYT